MADSDSEIRIADSDPAPLPVTHGRLREFTDGPAACLRRLHAEHGELAALQEDDVRLHFIFGPRWNRFVLSDRETFHSRFFTLRGPRNSAQRRLTSGLLSMNGEQHREHRRTVSGPFQKRMLAVHQPAVVDMARSMLDEWSVGEVRDMHLDMTRYMLRVTSGLLFGIDVMETAYRLGEMIDDWVHHNHQTGIGAFISNSDTLANYDRLLADGELLEAEIRDLIARRRASSKQGSDVLSILIAAADRDGSISDDELIGHVALLFGAAHLTTAHSLTWTLFLLAQHPEEMRRVGAEVTNTLGEDEPSPDAIESMPLLERVIKESMRILPASGYSQRVCALPVNLGPFRLSRGAPVIFSQFITHRIPSLYPSPMRYTPDRWLTLNPSPYEYLPFGAGPRMCIGAPLAMTILKTTLPMFFQRFRCAVVSGAEINAAIVSTMLGPTSPVPMRLLEADAPGETVPVGGNIVDFVELPAVDAERRRAA